MKKKISLFSLVVLIVASIDNIRNLPSAALFGSSLFFFFAFAAIFFLIPTALVSAELSSLYPDKGGVYHWVHKAFGKKWAMTAIWLQWINTMVWYPTMLCFVAGTLAYLINPELAHNKFYLISCILTIFWGLTFINLKGVHISALLNNIFATIGTVFPLLFLCVLGGIWLFLGKPLQIDLHPKNLIPPLSESNSWISLIAIMASFLGMELSGVHINEMQNPKRNFPKAIGLATLFIFLTMLIGSLSIAIVLPEKEINLVAGVMQVFNTLFATFGLTKYMPILTILVFIGSIGTMINWLISPAKGLLHAAEFGFLPPFFCRKNKNGVATNILLTQAVMVTLFSLTFLFVPSVNAFYWFLTALSTELYMLMYILMFSACLSLRKEKRKIWITTLLGLTGCIITITVSFFPPEAIHIASKTRYLIMIGGGTLIALSPLLFFFLYERRKKSQSCVTAPLAEQQ